MIREALGAASRGVSRQLDAGEHWLFAGKKAAYGLAVMRICLGVAILGSLTASFLDRHYVWGPGARWMEPWLSTDQFGFPFTSFFGEGDSTAVFTAKYAVLFVVAVLFTLGWRTRVVTPVLLILLTGLMRLDQVATDAGDNIARIMLLYLCFADSALRWSLDARRRARAAAAPAQVRRGRSWSPPPWLGTLFHNVALIAVAAQIFVIYLTSGLSKVQGEMWQEGVGLYYPLRIGQYAPFPGLNEIVYSNGLFVTVGSYVTVFVQLFFPLLLMRRGTRVVALLAIFVMHVSIAVTMALPWFSLAMLAGDAIFVRDATYRALARWVRSDRRNAREPSQQAASVASPPAASPTADVTPAPSD